MRRRFFAAADQAIADVRHFGLTPRTTKGRGGGARGKSGGGGSAAKAPPIWQMRLVDAKPTATPAMLRRRSKNSGKGKTESAGGISGFKALKREKRRNMARGDFKPNWLLRDQFSDWFKSQKLHALIQFMSLSRKPAQLLPKAQDPVAPPPTKKPGPRV